MSDQGPAPRHGVIGEIAYSVEGFPTHGIGGFVGEGVEKEMLEGSECL